MDEVPVINEDAELALWLADPTNDGRVVQTKLRPSDRVIARVTDGIYRQPASALRELISNAWDADAQNVAILTDAPRFSRIYVRDDGAGMSDRTLARLLHNIGGSAKRRDEGQELGLASESDPELTPGGRKIIGKIGIGLFSVSQLARRFEIITKVTGSNFRLITEIRLHQYAEDNVAVENDDEFIAGDVFIRRENTDDLDAHGTDIIMDDIKPRVRDILRSADRWQAVAEREDSLERGDFDTWANLRVERPVYHSGFTGTGAAANQISILTEQPQLPWSSEDADDVRMSKLMDAVEGEFSKRDRPDLANTLDTYLDMIWSLSGSRQTIGGDIARTWSGTDENFLKIFVLGLAKHLMQFFHGQPNLPAEVELVSAFAYRVHGQQPDMLSMAFRVRPSGLKVQPATAGGTVIGTPIELKGALAAAERVAKLWLLEAGLEEDEVRSDAVLGTIDRLESANYDLVAWELWLADHNIRPMRL